MLASAKPETPQVSDHLLHIGSRTNMDISGNI